MLRTIVVIQKKDRFSLGYKPDRRERQKFMEEKKEKRIASFFGNEKKKARMEIPPLSYTFRSVDFINPKAIQGKDKEISVDKVFESLSIDMVEVEDLEAMSIGLPPFPRGQVLDNWTTVELSVVFNLQNE